MGEDNCELITKIKGKFKIDSDNPKAPIGNFIVEFKDDTMKLATWKDDIFEKFKTGDEVKVLYNKYREDENYGKSACIVHIENLNKTLDETIDESFTNAKDYVATFNEKEKELLKENLGEDVINVSALPEPPKEIILEVGQLYKIWSHYYKYEHAKLVLVEE
jgi:hypothetical protein